MPFLLREVTERGALDQRDLSALRLVVYGGEPYPTGALAELMSALPGVGVVNFYGPAEVNAVTAHWIHDPSSLGDDVPIGRPLPTAEIRLVDDQGVDVPDGTPGELWASAETVMDHYWHRPELDAERLHPRDDGPDWYATGDVAMRDADGTLWFLGRRDHQVKVRGVRLELEAIEAVLTDAPGVAHAVAGVIGGRGESHHVAAAVVPRDGAEVDGRPVRRWCRERLPVAAIPATIEIRTAFPATGSGKIDRRTVRAELTETP